MRKYIGSFYIAGNLIANHPDYVADRAADVTKAGYGVAKGTIEGTVNGIKDGWGWFSSSLTSLVWGTTEQIKYELQDIVAPANKPLTLWSLLYNPLISFNQVINETIRWRPTTIDLIPLIPQTRPTDHDLLSRLLNIFLLDIYAKQDRLVDSVSHLNICVSKWIRDEKLVPYIQQLNADHTTCDALLSQIKAQIMSAVVIAAIIAFFYIIKLFGQALFYLSEALYKRLYNIIRPDTIPPSLLPQSRIGKIDQELLKQYRFGRFLYGLFKGHYTLALIYFPLFKAAFSLYNYAVLQYALFDKYKAACILILEDINVIVTGPNADIEQLFFLLQERCTFFFYPATGLFPCPVD